MRRMTCSSEPLRGAQSPKSRLVQTKYCCMNAPFARPSNFSSTILHCPKTSSKPLLVNDPVNPQRTGNCSITRCNALKRLPDGFLSLVSSSNTIASKLVKFCPTNHCRLS